MGLHDKASPGLRGVGPPAQGAGRAGAQPTPTSTPARIGGSPEANVPSLGQLQDTFAQVMESEAVADAMKYDSVRPESLLTLVES
jgi:hypothetical protein